MSVLQFLTGGTPLPSKSAEAGRALLRIGTGLILLLGHGIGKLPPSAGFIERVGEMGFPFPDFFAWMCVFAEVGCALLLAAGLATRFAAGIISLNMLTVVFLAQAGRPLGDRELATMLLLSAVFYLLAGAGRYSVDYIAKRQTRSESRVTA